MAGFFNKGFFSNFGQFEEESERSHEPVDNKKLYEVLEVPTTATQDQIKASFRKLAKTNHPDKGGDQEKFKEINAAYEILSNPEKRKVYDQYGFEGLKSGGLGSSGFGDIFDIFFGGRHGRSGPKETPQLKPTVRQADIHLQDAYCGKMIKLNVERSVLCSGCEGKGGVDPRPCSTCRGKGVVIRMVQLGPGMYSQTQGECSECEGTGKIIEKKNICKECKGKKLIQKNEKVEIGISIGVPDGERIVIHGKGNEHPEYKAGDLIVVVKIKKHGLFKRFKNDLFMEKGISLIEGLGGFSFNLDHVNGETVTVQSNLGTVVNNNQIMKVEGLGMPHHNNPMLHGDLYIRFNVQFPKLMTTEQVKGLR